MAKRLLHKLVTIFLLLKIITVDGFYVSHIENGFKETENQTVVEGILLNYKDDPYGMFPSEFTFTFKSFGKEYLLKFVKIDGIVNYVALNTHVYLMNGKNDFTVRTLKNDNIFATYRVEGHDATATLIGNTDINPKMCDEKFRMLLTLYDYEDGVSFQLLPILVKDNSNNKLKHVAYKKAIEQTASRSYAFSEEVEQPSEAPNNQQKKNSVVYKRSVSKRATSNSPVKLYVETLMVIDYSTYQFYADTISTNDSAVLQLYLKIYFAHMLAAVDQRFTNTFLNDTQLSINVRLNGLLILTNPNDSSWTDVNNVGVPGITQFGGNEVIDSNLTLFAFKNYMSKLSLTTSYDLAIAIINKDLWSSNANLPMNERSDIFGLSYFKQICGSNRYIIVENLGMFSLVTIAHHIGYSLGSANDGDGLTDLLAARCPEIDNYLMSPYIGGVSIKLVNLYKFSSCSVAQFKNFLLSNGLPSTQASCLTNIPVDVDTELKYHETTAFGKLIPVDDQCKIVFGKTSSSCYISGTSVCSQLFCSITNTNSSCYGIYGLAALDGTPCNMTHVCSLGTCSAVRTSTGDCPTSTDSLIFNGTLTVPLPQAQMTCDAVINYLATVSNIDAVAFCNDPVQTFMYRCCNTCKKYKPITCADKKITCPSFIAFCNQSYTLNGVSILTQCPYTCQACTRTPLACADSTFTCQNGGKCVTKTNALPTDLIGYTCACTTDYTGSLCEKKNLCSPSPCFNGGTCYQENEFYMCKCKTKYTGIDCEISLDTTTTTKSKVSNDKSSNYTPQHLILFCIIIFIIMSI